MLYGFMYRTKLVHAMPNAFFTALCLLMLLISENDALAPSCLSPLQLFQGPTVQVLPGFILEKCSTSLS